MDLHSKKVSIIKEMITDDSIIIRSKAIQKYAELQNYSAESDLIRGLKRPPTEIDLACYIRALATINSITASGDIIALTNHKNDIVRLEVIKYIRKNHTPSYNTHLINALHDSNLIIRIEALDALGDNNVFSALPDILAATIISVSSEFIKHSKKILIDFSMQNPNDAQLKAIKSYKPGLSANNYKYIIVDGDNSTQETTQQIRDSIIHTLKEVPDIQTLTKIKDFFGDKGDASRQINTLFALKQLSIEIPTRDLTAKIFTANSTRLKVEILKALKSSNDIGWIDIIIQSLSTMPHELKVEAIRSLKGIQNDNLFDVIIDEFIQCPIDDTAYLDVLLQTMGDFDTQKIVKPIIHKIKEAGLFPAVFSTNLKFFKNRSVDRIILPFLGSKVEENIINAVNALAKKGNTSALSHLAESYYKQTNSTLRKLIIEAIQTIDSDEAIEYLLKFALTESESDIIASLETTIKITASNYPDSYASKLYTNALLEKKQLKDTAILILNTMGMTNIYDDLFKALESDAPIKTKKSAISLINKSKKENYISKLLDLITDKNQDEEIRDYIFDKVFR